MFDVEFQKNGSAKLNANYKALSVAFTFDTKGTWTLEDKDEKLRLDFEDNEADGTYTILKLKEKELWLKEAGGEEELHLKTR